MVYRVLQVGTLFAVGVVVHMAVRVPCNFLWRWAAGKFGKYPTYMCLEFPFKTPLSDETTWVFHSDFLLNTTYLRRFRFHITCF